MLADKSVENNIVNECHIYLALKQDFLHSIVNQNIKIALQKQFQVSRSDLDILALFKKGKSAIS